MTDDARTNHRARFEQLAHVLAQCRMELITGAMHLIGTPGGIFHLRRGALVGVSSPGAPGADVLLLRSGRISESDWAAALRTGAETRSRQAELVAQGSIKATELHVISTMAAQDGTFAAFAGTLERYVIIDEPLAILLPVTAGVDITWLLQETSRRLDALAALRFPVSPFRDRVAAVPGVDPSETTLTLQQEILAVADGRRSARDIAFLIGRSVYTVTVAISRMLGEGLVEIVPVTPLTAPAEPRKAVPRAAPPETEQSVPEDSPCSGLPQRRPGTSGITDEQVALKPLGWLTLPQLRKRTRAGPTKPSETVTESASDPERSDLEP